MITGDHPETAIAIGKMLGIVDPTAAHARAYTGAISASPTAFIARLAGLPTFSERHLSPSRNSAAQ
jgi:magnesium-transporting ATPase (P-type)